MNIYDSNSRGISFLAGFFMLIAFTVAGLILASIIAVMVWTAMTGLPTGAMEKGLNNAAYINANRVAHAINFLVGLLLPAIVTARLLNKKPYQLMGFSPKVTGRQCVLVVGIMLFALLAGSGLAYFNELIPLPKSLAQWALNAEADYGKQITAIVGLNNASDYIFSLILLALLPALCEEAVFRGGLQNFLTKHTRKPWLSIIIVSVLFSAAHFSIYGFFTRLFLGIVLGLIYYYSGKLWLSILAHFINNAIAITVMYSMMQSGKTVSQTINQSNETWWGVLAIPIVVVLFGVFKKHSTIFAERRQY